jgi:hypothetical protein
VQKLEPASFNGCAYELQLCSCLLYQHASRRGMWVVQHAYPNMQHTAVHKRSSQQPPVLPLSNLEANLQANSSRGSVDGYNIDIARLGSQQKAPLQDSMALQGSIIEVCEPQHPGDPQAAGHGHVAWVHYSIILAFSGLFATPRSLSCFAWRLTAPSTS